MMPLKGLINLGIWFWLSLPLLGILLWVGSGWLTNQQLKQDAHPVESIQIKRPGSRSK
jgi:hypothetical protein